MKIYSYEDVPTVERFSIDHSPYRALIGPWGSGKSSGCVAECIRRGQWQRRSPDGVRHSRWAVVRNTFPELEKTTIRTFFEWFPPHHFGRYVGRNHEYTIKGVRDFENGPCDIEVWFLALDRREDVAKLLSLEITGAWINEGREVPWAIFEALFGRCGRYPSKTMGGPSWYGLWSDTNPPDSDSDWYRFFEEQMGADKRPLPPGYAKIFHQPSGLSKKAENVPNLPGAERYYSQLIIGKSEEWIKVFARGEYGFVMDGRAVFGSEWSDRLHVLEVDPLPGVPIIRSWDFGLTPACVFSQLMPDGRWLVFDEMLSNSMGVDQFSDEVLERCNRAFRWEKPRFEDWGDPAGEQRAQTDTRTCFDIMRGKKIMVEGSIQNVQMRLESIRKPLRTIHNGEPQFVLHPRCKALRKGFQGGYHYRRIQAPGAERFTDIPNKNQFSHPMDALSYACVKYFAPVLLGAEADDDELRWEREEATPAMRGADRVTGYARRDTIW